VTTISVTPGDFLQTGLVSTLSSLLSGTASGSLVCVELGPGAYQNGVFGVITVPAGVHFRLLGSIGSVATVLLPWVAGGDALRVEAASGATVEIARVDIRNVAPTANGTLLRLDGASAEVFRVDSCALSQAAGGTSVVAVGAGVRAELQNLLIERRGGGTGTDGIVLERGTEVRIVDSAIGVSRRSTRPAQPPALFAGLRAERHRHLHIENCWFADCVKGALLADVGGLAGDDRSALGTRRETEIADCRFVRCGTGVERVRSSTASAGIAFPDLLDIQRSWFGPGPVGSEDDAVGVLCQPDSQLPVAGAAAVHADHRVRIASCMFDGLGAGVRWSSSATGPVLLTHNTYMRCATAGVDLEDLPPGLDRQTLIPPLRDSAGGGVLVTTPRIVVINSIFLIEPWPGPVGPPGGGVLLPARLAGAVQTAYPVGPSGLDIVVAANLFRATTPWLVTSTTQVLRVFVRTGGAAWNDLFWVRGWQFAGTDWENRVVVLVNGSTAMDGGNDPALARPNGPNVDVHPTRIGSSVAIGRALPSRPQIGPTGLQPTTDLFRLLGFPDAPTTGYYNNERPRRASTQPGGPALGAAEPAGWVELPIMVAQVGTTSLQDAVDGPRIAAMCDMVQRAYFLPDTPPPPTFDPADQAAYWFFQQDIIDWLHAVDALGLKGVRGVPVGVDQNLGFTYQSPSGVSQGVSFELPTGKDEFRPAFAVWLSELLPYVLHAILADEVARRALIGLWGPEEFRPNAPYQWNGYYLAQRLRRTIEAAAPGLRFMTYLQNFSSPGLALTGLGTSIGNAPPVWLGTNPGLLPLRMGGIPTTFPGNSLDYAAALFAEVGVADRQLRWHIYDGRGFAADIPTFVPTNQATWPRDADGNLSTFTDPNTEFFAAQQQGTTLPADRWVMPDGVAEKDAVSGVPFLDGGPIDNSTVSAAVPDRYRPWQFSSEYYGSWYALTDGLGFVPPVTDHYLGGNYVDRSLGWNVTEATTNRIVAYQRVKSVTEGRTSARQMLGKYRQQLGDCKAFHVLEPNIHTNDGQYLAPATRAFGRHDFWVGMHELDGVLVYPWGERHYRDSAGSFVPLPGWEGYEESMRLLKSTVREFIVAGERVDVGFQFLNAWPQGAPGEKNPGSYQGTTVGYVRDWNLVNVTGFLLRDAVAVVLTASYDQQADFKLGVTGPLGAASSVSNLIPASAVSATPSGADWDVTTVGIDGTVLLFQL